MYQPRHVLQPKVGVLPTPYDLLLVHTSYDVYVYVYKSVGLFFCLVVPLESHVS